MSEDWQNIEITPRMIAALIAGVVAIFILVMLSKDTGKPPAKREPANLPPRVWTSADEPGSLPASGPIRNLHNLAEVTTLNSGARLIERWRWERGSAYVWLEPGPWNSMSHSQQRQLLDQIANSTFMDGLVNMWLYVGATDVGRIKPKISGGFEFVAANQ
jgi:hypothetical protein